MFIRKGVTMQKNMKQKRSLYTYLDFYLVLLNMIFTVGILIQIFLLNILPLKYYLIVATTLILFTILLTYLLLNRKISQFKKILAKILIILLCIILGTGNWYVFKTHRLLYSMMSNKELAIISVITMKNSDIDHIDDLKNKSVGIINIGDVEKQYETLSKIEKTINDEIEAKPYTSYKNFIDDLYNGNVDAIILNESSRESCKENHKDFDEKTKIIKSFKYEKDAKDIAKSVKITEEPFNVYISGMDTHGSLSTQSHSDVNMIVTINPKTHQILMTGIPRDLYIPQVCQQGQVDKLTHSGAFGLDCTVKSVEDFFNIDLNYYVKVNFSSVEQIVDALGGITVHSDYDFVTVKNKIHIHEGENKLNGIEALSFVRERKAFADGDQQRSRNQMIALEAIINKALSPSIITKYPKLMSAVSGTFQTNMSQYEMTNFVKKQLETMASWDIKQIQVGGSGDTSWSPANGFYCWVLVPNEDTIKNAVNLINKVQNGEKLTKEDINNQKALVLSAG